MSNRNTRNPLHAHRIMSEAIKAGVYDGKPELLQAALESLRVLEENERLLNVLHDCQSATLNVLRATFKIKCPHCDAEITAQYVDHPEVEADGDATK